MRKKYRTEKLFPLQFIVVYNTFGCIHIISMGSVCYVYTTKHEIEHKDSGKKYESNIILM